MEKPQVGNSQEKFEDSGKNRLEVEKGTLRSVFRNNGLKLGGNRNRNTSPGGYRARRLGGIPSSRFKRLL